MKIVKWAMVFLSSAFVSCSQQDEFLSGGDGTEITTQISVSVPDLFKSRAVSDVYNEGEDGTYIGESGMPSIGNVDLQKHPLSFTVGIYIAKTSAGTTEPMYTLVEKQSKINVANDEAYFNFRLLKDQQYRIVAYADFSGEEKNDLQAIEYTTKLNDELSDAFFASQDFEAKPDVAVVLKRPFGKLRLIAQDFYKFAAGEVFEFTNVKVNFKRQPMLATTLFNALNGDFNYDQNAEGNHTKEAAPVIYTKEYQADGTAKYAAVFTMYLPANFGVSDPNDPYKRENPEDTAPIPQSWSYPLDVEITYTNKQTGKTTAIKRSFDIDIPVKRNYLTTIETENFWTDNSSIKVSVDHRFDGFIDPKPEAVTVKSADELQDAIDAICNGSSISGKIVLGSDINADENHKIASPGGFVFESSKAHRIYLDLNGYTIYTEGKHTPQYLSDNSTYNVGGVFRIGHYNNILHISDSSESANGSIAYLGSADNGYPLIICANGGQAVINSGLYVSNSLGPVVYVQNSLMWHATALNTAYIKAGVTKTQTTGPTEAQMQTIKYYLESFSSKATINGGWFEDAHNSNNLDHTKVTINGYNVTKDEWNRKYDNDNNKPYWDIMCWRFGYQKWASFGEEYVNSCYGFVYINGGSYVDFNPAHDNVAETVQVNEWVDDKHTILKETIDGKTVYTVISNSTPNY